MVWRLAVTLVSLAKRRNRSRSRLGWGLGWAQGSTCQMGPRAPCKGAIIRKRTCTGMPNDSLSWVVQIRLNRSICRLCCGLKWTEGSTSSIVFARWHQCSHMWGHIGATWRIRLNCPSAAAMRPYVKLLWPLVIITNKLIIVCILFACRLIDWFIEYGLTSH